MFDATCAQCNVATTVAVQAARRPPHLLPRMLHGARTRRGIAPNFEASSPSRANSSRDGIGKCCGGYRRVTGRPAAVGYVDQRAIPHELRRERAERIDEVVETIATLAVRRCARHRNFRRVRRRPRSGALPGRRRLSAGCSAHSGGPTDGGQPRVGRRPRARLGGAATRRGARDP